MSGDPAGDTVAGLVRQADFGRYAATLFAPAAARPHLLALYAFDVELARVRDLVSEPMPGELRLQWWRDALDDPERADVVSHPVAKALMAAIAYGRLPREALHGVVEARVDDLYDDPTTSVSALEHRFGVTRSAIVRLASLIAAVGEDPGGAEAAGYAGVAAGLVGLLRLLRRDPARALTMLPVDRMAAHGVSRDEVMQDGGGAGLRALSAELAGLARARIGEARAAFMSAKPEAAPAFLPIALVAKDLDAIERKGKAPDPSNWLTLARLWRASRRRPPF